VILTRVTTIAFLSQRHHPEDDGIIGRNMLVKIL